VSIISEIKKLEYKKKILSIIKENTCTNFTIKKLNNKKIKQKIKLKKINKL